MVIFGAVSDLVRERLLREMPDKFETPRRCSFFLAPCSPPLIYNTLELALVIVRRLASRLVESLRPIKNLFCGSEV